MIYNNKTDALKNALARYDHDEFHVFSIDEDCTLEDRIGAINRFNITLKKHPSYFPHVCIIDVTDDKITVVPVFPISYKELASSGDILTSRYPYYLETWNSYSVPISQADNFVTLKSNIVDEKNIVYGKLSRKELKRIVDETRKKFIVTNKYVLDFRSAETSITNQIRSMFN